MEGNWCSDLLIIEQVIGDSTCCLKYLVQLLSIVKKDVCCFDLGNQGTLVDRADLSSDEEVIRPVSMKRKLKGSQFCITFVLYKNLVISHTLIKLNLIKFNINVTRWTP